MNAFTVIATASGRTDDQALVWALRAAKSELEVPEATLWTTPKKFRTLSRKISLGLQKQCKSDLGHRVSQMVEDNMNLGRTIPGLVLLRFLVKWYASGTKNEQMYALNDLQRVKISNGNIETMQSLWIMVNTGLRVQQPDETLEEIYFDIIKDHPSSRQKSRTTVVLTKTTLTIATGGSWTLSSGLSTVSAWTSVKSPSRRGSQKDFQRYLPKVEGAKDAVKDAVKESPTEAITSAAAKALAPGANPPGTNLSFAFTSNGALAVTTTVRTACTAIAVTKCLTPKRAQERTNQRASPKARAKASPMEVSSDPAAPQPKRALT